MLDPFMGAGSTIAAAEALGYEGIGVEVDPEYFKMAQSVIPRLAALHMNIEEYSFDVAYYVSSLPLFAN